MPHDRYSAAVSKARRARRWRQVDLAAASRLPERAVQRLEAGTGSVGSLMAALSALDLDLIPAPSNPRQHISTLNAGSC